MPQDWSRRAAFCGFGCSMGLIASSLTAGPQPLHPNSAPSPASITNAAVTKLAPGLYQIGQVQLDKEKKTISFPAVVNMHEGNVEYVVVHSSGKVHESIFKTEAEPYHINVALLLLGAKGGRVTTKTPQKKTSDVFGDALKISAVWTTNNNTVRFPIEDLLVDVERKGTASKGPWLYNGSRIIDGVFLAQRDGSIVCTIADPDALVNNPRPARDNDDAWLVNTTNTPPVNTPVQITFQLQQQDNSRDLRK